MLRPALASAILALLVFLPCLGGTLVLDDRTLMADPRLQSIDQWPRFLTESYNGGLDQLWRPITSFTLALQYALHGDLPWPYHAVNWMLHALASALVAVLAWHAGGARCAWGAGLLFAVLPVHAEAVVNIAGRGELLAAVCALGCLVVLVSRPITTARACIATLLFTAGLLCKEHVMVLPLVMMAIVPAFKPAVREGQQRSTLVSLFAMMTLLIASLVIYRQAMQTLALGWDRAALDVVINPLVAAEGWDRHLWLPLEIVGRYAVQSFAPLTLSADHNYAVITAVPHWPHVVLGVCTVVLALTLMMVAASRRRWPVAACWLAAMIAYGPASNFITLIGTAFGERLMYLPSAFLLMAVVMTLDDALPGRRGVVALAMVVIVYGTRSTAYTLTWNDELSFWQRQAQVQPASVRVQLNLADAYLRRGELAAAEEVSAGTRAAFPEVGDAWLQAGQIAMERGDYDTADLFLGRSAALDPTKRAIGLMHQVSERRDALQSGQ